MNRALSLGAVVLILAGCATADGGRDRTPASMDLTRQTQEDARAKHYLSVLWAKKNRFEQSHPELFEAPESQAIATDNSKLAAVSECRKMDAGRWAESVRYGQDFTSYENYIVAMERCLNGNG